MRRLFVAICCALATVSCSHSETKTVTVFAASSLQGAYFELGSNFMRSYPEYKMVFSFDSSTQLAHQIIDGAPADVFASADTGNMDLVQQGGELADTSVVFAANHLQILVSSSASGRIHSLADLSSPDVVVVLAAADVPLGKYTAEVLKAAGVTVSPASYEPNAASVVSKVVGGEADAGIVYVSDVVGAGSAAVGIDIPAETNVEVVYPIAVTHHGALNSGAALWVKFVLSETSQEILHKYGFAAIGGN
ncbi:MAG: molybdate ABC transporter substrate-binding protein [Ilumatobacteraceae bacterium]